MPKAAHDISGYLLLHKNGGLTSFDSLHQVKRALKTGKIGHTGTLDKFAEGLLVILVGKYTSLVPIFNELDKVYIGTIRFGEETDTLDPEGKLILTAPVPPKERILQVLPSFLGHQFQIPPVYSAIHVDGQRASERVRSGQTISMQAREITIHSIDVLYYNEPYLTIRIHCSKGTYIRALARDIGKASGSCAYLDALQRVAVGPFCDDDSLHLEPGSVREDTIQKALKPVNPELFHQLNIPHLFLNALDEVYIMQGRPLQPIIKKYSILQESPLLGIFSNKDRLLALVEQEKINGSAVWKYKHVYPH